MVSRASTPSAFGIELRNFGPGLFFAGLGAVILVTTMRAALDVGADTPAAPLGAERPPEEVVESDTPPSTALFLGLEDPTRVAAELPDEELIAAFAIPIRPESPTHCALMAPMPTLAFV